MTPYNGIVLLIAMVKHNPNAVCGGLHRSGLVRPRYGVMRPAHNKRGQPLGIFCAFSGEPTKHCSRVRQNAGDRLLEYLARYRARRPAFWRMRLPTDKRRALPPHLHPGQTNPPVTRFEIGPGSA